MDVSVLSVGRVASVACMAVLSMGSAYAQVATSACDGNSVDSTCLSGTNMSYGVSAKCTNAYACGAGTVPSQPSTSTDNGGSTPSNPSPSSGGSVTAESRDSLTWNDSGASGSAFSVANASVGQSYAQTLVGATSSTGLSVSYSISGGLPDGISLSQTPELSGTTNNEGTSNVTLIANDGPNQITRTIALTVDAADYLYWETPNYEHYWSPFTPIESSNGGGTLYMNSTSVPTGLVGMVSPLMGAWDLNDQSAPARIRAISSTGKQVHYYIVPLGADVINAWKATHMDGNYSYFTGPLGTLTSAVRLSGTGTSIFQLDSLLGNYGTNCAHTTQTLTAIMATDGVATTAVPEYLAVSYAQYNCGVATGNGGGGTNQQIH